MMAAKDAINSAFKLLAQWKLDLKTNFSPQTAESLRNQSSLMHSQYLNT